MHPGSDSKYIPMTSRASGVGRLVRDDVYYYTNQIVNIVLVGHPDNGHWVLVDAGMPKSAEEILKVCRERFGDTPPAAIVLTHGHFDHVGSLVALLNTWRVPVYAHPLEFPYLTGKTAYPEPDVTVEGGLLAKLSFLYPIEPVDIQEVLQPLPSEGSVPNMPGWEWIHTPGHSPGHVSLFRESDRTLLSGDAVVTVRQDSLYKVLFQKTEVNGPPRYLTTNWPAARDAVIRLAALHPELVVAGHGHYMEGVELREGLERLVEHFEALAIPSHGKYVHAATA
ncbi:MBL fold metallo-hydrolase [Fulvivirgaceae bacterium PWU5]|uniref:MBL fold metallo-hydrolase n=1 Tax=Dawidia cretensis TaxID=2782350 RepID=A0AAP2DVD7_9BACT|nr:MBL fold metallo-hydrolase [Dawidia cretensis]MBT1707946.1 MBL fold metallo-hydrolase [Dawidia cretensis]